MSADHAKTPKTKRRVSTKHKLLFTGGVFGLFVLILIGVEIRYRIKERGKPVRVPFILRDPYTGFALVPSREFQPGPGLTTHLHTNSLGHRGAEMSTQKPPGTFRIACLGGSSTWGTGATEDETAYPAVLERLLREAYPDRSIEVFNAGVLTWTSRKSLTNYKRKLAPLDFDLVIVLHCANDWTENSSPNYVHDSFVTTDLQKLYRPEAPRSFLMEHSVAYRVFTIRWAKHEGKYNKVTTVKEEGVEAFRRNLRAVVSTLRKDGARVLFSTYPHIYPATSEEAMDLPLPLAAKAFMVYKAPIKFELQMPGMDRYNQIVRDIASEQGVPLVDLAKTFPKDPSLFVDFIHNNDAGHALRAKLVFETIQREKLLLE